MKNICRKTLAMMMSAGILSGALIISQPAEKKMVNAAISKQTLMYGVKPLTSGVNSDNAATVYMGNYDAPIAWRVIGYNGTQVSSKSNAGCLTLLSSKAIGKAGPFNSQLSRGNSYSGSALQTRLNDLFSNASYFSSLEQAAVAGKTLVTSTFSSVEYPDGVAGTKVTDAKLWPLSTKESTYLNEKIRDIDVDWWLCSPGDSNSTATYVGDDGNYHFFGDTVTKNKYSRPAMNVKEEEIFLTTANGLKSNSVSSVSKMTKITNATTNEWKLTLYDDSRKDFRVSCYDEREVDAGGVVMIDYNGAKSGSSEFVSVIVADMHGEPLYYGHIANNSTSGSARFVFPRDLQTGEYYLKVFSEQCNGDKKTDYSSVQRSLTFHVNNPGTVRNIKCTPAGRNKVKLSWDAVPTAEGYLIYAQKDGVYGFVGMTTQGTTYTDVNALDTDYNYYWVFAFITDSQGRRIPGKCQMYAYGKGVCAAVTGLRASSGSGYVKLTWNQVADADGYLIYGIRPGGEYGYIGMTTTGTSFTDRSASASAYTFYWVYPYHLNNGKMIPGGTANYTYGKSL